MVCERCKFTSKRTVRVICDVLAMERDSAGLTDTAERLVKAWVDYREAIEWPRRRIREIAPPAAGVQL
jgi:hypothetical protein